MYSKNLNAYKATQILTADPGKIILMLYDAAIVFLEQAAAYAQERAFEARARKIAKANDIILELLASLDFEAGGEIARNLCDIYAFLVQELLKADAENNHELILKCRQVLVTLNEGWVAIVNAGPEVEGGASSRAELRYSATA